MDGHAQGLRASWQQRQLSNARCGLELSTMGSDGAFVPSLQDKDAKVAYLSKIINVVSIVLGQPCPARPLKVLGVEMGSGVVDAIIWYR